MWSEEPNCKGMRFAYVLTTVLLNAMMIVGVALAFNDPFRWRRYPAALVTTRAPSEIRKQLGEDLSEKDMDRPYARAYAFSGATRPHFALHGAQRRFTSNNNQPSKG